MALFAEPSTIYVRCPFSCDERAFGCEVAETRRTWREEEDGEHNGERAKNGGGGGDGGEGSVQGDGAVETEHTEPKRDCLIGKAAALVRFMQSYCASTLSRSASDPCASVCELFCPSVFVSFFCSIQEHTD